MAAPIRQVPVDAFAQFIDGVEDYAIFMLGPDGSVATWNRGAEKLKGYRPGEILGKHFSTFYPAEDNLAGKPARELEQALREGRVEDEGFRVRKDGSLFWAEVTITALRDERGGLIGFAKITRDLSERRAAEQALRQSEERFRLLLDSIDDYAFFLLDPQGRIETWNRGAERILGYTPQEVLGRNCAIFYAPEDVAAHKPTRELASAERAGRFEHTDFRVHKDGGRFWASVAMTALRGEGGETRGFAMVTRDLSYARAAQEALHSSEERFRALVEAVADYAIYMLDPTGIVATWNPGAQRLKGYAAHEIIGRNFAVFFPEADVRAGKPTLELNTALTQGRFEEEAYRVRKDGTRFWANVVLTPVRGAAGQLLGFAKVTRDLTQRLEAERTAHQLVREQAARAQAEADETRLREAAARAEDANRVKDEFLATVSHELRTPLNAILGWASLLRGRGDDLQVAKGIEVIHRNAEAQRKIIDDILDVSRIITGKLRLDVRQVDLAAIVRDAIEVVRPSAAAKHLDIEFAPTQLDCALVADAERLQQVAWNLLSNAVKFSGAGGRIQVLLRRDGSSVVLEVSDTGAGIEPGFLPFVFDRFKQADGSTTRRVGGLGLGLAIVRHLVELHGGRVDAKSEGMGKGATFAVTLPVRAVAPSTEVQERAAVDTPPRGAAPPVPGVRLRGTRVLVVDDEPDARELLEAVLTAAGGEVATAASAAEGFAMLQRFRPHVLVSDIGMPEEDGFAFIQRVKALSSAAGGGLPSIALTAYTRAEDKTKALAQGFTTHVGKPVNPDDLVATVANLAAIVQR